MKKRVTLLTLWLQLLAAGVCISLNMPMDAYARYGGPVFDQARTSQIQGWPFVFSYILRGVELSGSMKGFSFYADIFVIVLVVALVRYAIEGQFLTRPSEVAEHPILPVQGRGRRSVWLIVVFAVSMVIYARGFRRYVSIIEPVPEKFPMAAFDIRRFELLNQESRRLIVASSRYEEVRFLLIRLGWETQLIRPSAAEYMWVYEGDWSHW